MKNRIWLTLTVFALMVGWGFMGNVSPAYAIGEVTPTPAPQETTPTINIPALIEDALAALQSGQYMSAVNATDQILAVEPENVEALTIRGVSYVRLNRFQQAIDDFTAGITIAPYQWDLLLLRGDTYVLMSDNVSALLDYDQAIEIYPLNFDAFARRAELNYNMGNNREGDVDDFIARGIEAMGGGDLQSARDYFSAAIDGGSGTSAGAVAYYNRGISQLDQGKDDLAIADFTSALAANPRLHNAYLARGISYRQAGDIQLAGSDFFNRITLHGRETLEQSMAVGDTIEVEMAYRRVYSITFEGQEGQVVTISARDAVDTAIDPLIALLDPQGNPIAGDDDFGGVLDSLIEDFTLPASGSYTLLVSHAEGGYQFGFEGIVTVEIEN